MNELSGSRKYPMFVHLGVYINWYYALAVTGIFPTVPFIICVASLVNELTHGKKRKKWIYYDSCVNQSMYM